MDILGNRGSGSLDDHHQSMFAEVIVLMAAAFLCPVARLCRSYQRDARRGAYPSIGPRPYVNGSSSTPPSSILWGIPQTPSCPFSGAEKRTKRDIPPTKAFPQGKNAICYGQRPPSAIVFVRFTESVPLRGESCSFIHVPFRENRGKWDKMQLEMLKNRVKARKSD